MKQADEVRSEIESTKARFSAAMRRGDAKAMAALCGTRAQLLPPHSDFVDGREAIESFCRAGIRNGFAYLKLTSRQLDGRDHEAVETGRYRVYGPNGNLVDHGKYLVVWERDESGWKLHRGSWNSNRGIESL